MRKIILHGNVELISLCLARRRKCGGAVERKEKISQVVSSPSMNAMKILSRMRRNCKINFRINKNTRDANAANRLVIR